MAGHVEITVQSVSLLLPHVRTGKLRALGVTGAHRVAAAPDIPAIAEGGLPGYEGDQWAGLLAPAGTSRDIIARLYKESAYSDPQLLALTQKVSYEIYPNAGFPKYRSGEVTVRLKNGREISRRNHILPDKQAAEKDIFAKFMNNTKFTLSPPQARTIRDMIMNVDGISNTRTITRALAGRSV